MKVRRRSKHPDLCESLSDDRVSVPSMLPPAPVKAKPAVRRRKASSDKLGRSEVEATMRPPPPSDDDLDTMETLRPLSKAPADLERITPLRPPTLEALFHAEPTGALLKLLTPDRGHPLEEVKIPRKRR